jgi:hypothetical protein
MVKEQEQGLSVPNQMCGENDNRHAKGYIPCDVIIGSGAVGIDHFFNNSGQNYKCLGVCVN